MGDEVEVRPMTPADAVGVSECIARCYGDAYPKAVMYRPDELAALVGSRSYNGVVAASRAGVVGHIGFSRPTRESTVVEAGTTVVDPACRGMGLMGRLGVALAESVVAEGAVGFIHFPTTAHPVMQRASLSAGGRETGVMLAYLPAEARDRAMGERAEGRLAVTVVYQPLLESPPQDVHLPRRYRGRILELAGTLGLTRSAAPSTHTPSGETVLEHVFDASRGLQRIWVHHIGTDIAEKVTSVMRGQHSTSVHVDLPMNVPSIDRAVEELRRCSFAFAAWLPGWAGHDVLRLQFLGAPTEAELAPTLFSAEARALMAVIRAELLGAE